MIKSVQILGTSAGIPTIEQGVSSYIVSFSNYDIMVDCGEATTHQLMRSKLKFHKFDLHYFKNI